MNRLFIHNPLFRILSPIATGTLVYLLILLINNNLEQIQEQFLGQELYICIALAYIIQEFARFSIVIIKRLKSSEHLIRRTFIQFLVSIILTVLVVTVVMQVYFRYFLGYTPNQAELAIFYLLFSFITFIYLMLYTGHQFLFRINKERLQNEEKASRQVLKDFNAYRSEINSELLFECLECLLVLMKTDVDEAEELTDRFSSLYRYILLKKEEELVDLDLELSMIKEQVKVYNSLPYRKLEVKVIPGSAGLVIPMSLLKIVERIIKNTIRSNKAEIELHIDIGDSDRMTLLYVSEDTLASDFTTDIFKDINDQYQFYTDRKVTVDHSNGHRQISIPKLHLI